VCDENGERVQFGREETLDTLPNLGMGLGFGPQS
jgi:hypothetical protein